MSRYRWLIWGGVIIACGLVAWYRSTVYRTPQSPVAPHFKFVTGGSGPYWQIAAAGAKAAAQKYDVRLTIEMPETEESVTQQTQILSQLDFSDVQGLAISPLDADGQTLQINRVSDEMPVLTFDSDAPLSERLCYVGTTNYGAGQKCAKLVRQAGPEGGQIAVLQANLTKYNNIERKEGFEDTIHEESSDLPAGSSQYEVVGYFVDEGNPERCAQNIREVLNDHPDLFCFVGMNGHHGPILVDVLQEEGRLGDVKLVVFDAFPETLDGIAAGHIYATLAQDPYQYGYESIRLLKDYIVDRDSHALLGRGSVYFDAAAVLRADLEGFRKRLESQRQMYETDETETESAPDE